MPTSPQYYFNASPNLSERRSLDFSNWSNRYGAPGPDTGIFRDISSGQLMSSKPFTWWPANEAGYRQMQGPGATGSTGLGQTPPIIGMTRGQKLKQAYDAGNANFSDLFDRYQLASRYPEVSGATSKAMGDVAAMDSQVGIPNYNDLLGRVKSSQADINNWYQNYQAGNNIGDFASRMRAADAAAAALTPQLTKTAEGILGQAADVNQRYRTEGQSALDQVLANAQDFYNKDIPASIANAQNQATRYLSRYAQARGGGLGSDLGRIAGRSAVEAALPFQLQGRQFMGNALERYAPFYGDVAGREYGRLAGLSLPTEQNLYGMRQGDILRGKATEQAIQNLDLLVRERGLNAAIQNLRVQGMPEETVNQIVQQWQQLKSGGLGIVGQAAGLEQQYGGERGYNYIPGADVSNPTYFGLPNPNFPGLPSRYSPTVTATSGNRADNRYAQAGSATNPGAAGGWNTETGQYQYPPLAKWQIDQRRLSAMPARYANEGWQNQQTDQQNLDMANWLNYMAGEGA